jgi:hypothetical protein
MIWSGAFVASKRDDRSRFHCLALSAVILPSDRIAGGDADEDQTIIGKQ